MLRRIDVNDVVRFVTTLLPRPQHAGAAPDSDVVWMKALRVNAYDHVVRQLVNQY